MKQDEMKQAMKEALNEKFGDGKMFVPQEEHFKDHQFVQGQRKAVSFIKMGFLISMGGGLLTWAGWAIKTWIKGIGG